MMAIKIIDKVSKAIAGKLVVFLRSCHKKKLVHNVLKRIAWRSYYVSHELLIERPVISCYLKFGKV